MNYVLGLVLFLSMTPLLASKATPPLSLVLEPTTAPIAEAQWDLVATLSSKIDFEKVDVLLTLPSGVELVSGKSTSRIALKAGQYRELNYRLHLPKVLSGQVLISAEVQQGKAVKFVARDRLSLSESRRVGRSEATQGGHEFKQHHGRRLREYSLP